MPNRSATSAKPAASSSPLGPFSGDARKMRRKNNPLVRSPNWALSMMLQPRPARKPDTAATMPTVSGQEMVRIWRGVISDLPSFANSGPLIEGRWLRAVDRSATRNRLQARNRSGRTSVQHGKAAFDPNQRRQERHSDIAAYDGGAPVRSGD